MQLSPKTSLKASAKCRGLFLGLATLDIIYLAHSPLGTNEKQVAQDYQMSPGGPATNAAVTFAQLSDRNEAQLAAVIGQHPLTQIIRSDAQRWNIRLHDLAPEHREPPSLSSIVVNAQTGERAIISINAKRHQIAAPPKNPGETTPDAQFQDRLNGLDILLIDGHQMELSGHLAPRAQDKKIPVVVDGGSWKPGFEAVLSATDYAICSADFRPPGCHNEAEALAYLQGLGVPHIAFSHGDGPISYWQRQDESEPSTPSSTTIPRGESGEITVPRIQAVDTLGAGDIFHGAFCHYILELDFPQALEAAAAIASRACQSFGTRSWLKSSADGSSME